MQTGFVGLGAMGAHMARNLQACRTAHRRLESHRRESRGARRGIARASPSRVLRSLPANCEAVVICVSADEDVRAVVAGLEPGLSPRMIVMDCSTVGAGTARDMHARARRRSGSAFSTAR